MKLKLLILSIITVLVSCGKEDVMLIDSQQNNPSELKAARATIRVSEQTGRTNYDKLVTAIGRANSNNQVLVDVDINFTSSNKAIIINKDNVNIKGAPKGDSKYKFIRTGSYQSRVSIFNCMLVVTANKVSVDNITFSVQLNKAFRTVFIGNIDRNGRIANRTQLHSNISFLNCSFKQAVPSETTRGLFFEGSFKNILIDNCFFNNSFSVLVKDCPTIDNFTVNNSRFVDGSHQISFDGALLGETDPTYGLGINLQKHAKINITNNTFNITGDFNLALAHTENVYVYNNTFSGGTEDYSQPIHIEDESKNIRIVSNTLNSLNNSGIAITSTQRVGHGQGRFFSEAEMKAKGSGNIFIKNNTITSKDHGVIATHLKGYITIEGNNVINSRVKGVAVQAKNSNRGAKVSFVDNKSTYNGLKLNEALRANKIVIDSTNRIERP